MNVTSSPVTPSGATGARYRVQVLEAALGGLTAAQLARRVGVTRRTVQRWRRSGLSEERADSLACRCGLHPLVVWPAWADDGPIVSS